MVRIQRAAPGAGRECGQREIRERNSDRRWGTGFKRDSDQERKAWQAQQESELKVVEREFYQKLQTQEEAWRVELTRKDVELQQKGERLEAKFLELAKKWKSEGHCGEPGSPQFDPTDEMAWDTEGLPWPGLTVQFDPIDILIQNVEPLSVSRCPRMESSQGLDDGPPVDIVADEALSPGKAYRSDSQMVSKDWSGITKERRRRVVKRGQTPEVLGPTVAGRRDR
ncbi:hypothetical protein AAFF_G00295550 [Aldrovandia affinis]|uniref:Uncharacterized protein n=1 Tax=Aldrovandia affinis TaxID=143900 RepID=A0AAD7SPZ2_9TELE|nr:hypothetical protein AAFF_G00295550 [Aldrovandia affinis]